MFSCDFFRVLEILGQGELTLLFFNVIHDSDGVFCYGKVPPVRRLCGTESNRTALWGEAALFMPGYECNSPVAPSHFDHLV